MFLVGALLGVMAVNVLIMTVMGHKPSESFFGLKKYICTLVVVELLMVGSEIVALYMGPVKTVKAAKLLLTGEFSTWFIGLQIIVGSLLPLSLLVTIDKGIPKRRFPYTDFNIAVSWCLSYAVYSSYGRSS